jgi:hypothetical protein
LIEAYVAELDGALRGPRHLRADMIAEARDGLLDACEAYEKKGLDPDRAQRRAIDDFGPVSVIVPEYQMQLGLSQGRRTALLTCAALGAQPIAWRVIMPLVGQPDPPGSAAYQLVNRLVECVGALSIAAGLVIALALGVGTRYFPPHRRMARIAGFFALAVSAVFAVLGSLMTLLGPARGPLLGWSGLPTTLVLLGLPLVGIALAGRRCLAAARG